MGVDFAPAAWALDSSRSLVIRVRGSDRAAFRVIFDRCAPAVYRLLRDLLRDHASADEATQETFVRAYRRLDSIRDDDRVSGTPTFFINGRKVVGAQPASAFSAVIDEELGKASALVQTGAK